MPTIEITPVVLHYTTFAIDGGPHGGMVDVRVRTYAAEKAIEERSHLLAESEVQSHAEADGRSTWDERDLCALIPDAGALWSGTDLGAQLKKDITAPSEQAAYLKAAISTLAERLVQVAGAAGDATLAAIAVPAQLIQEP